ncbi:MFS transporter [Saccharopolyspora sp. CA-218241]|uniref:MFS transporter n=1 Tax=Saccharopolyspora sp. CA-218241 TaxID=3240027 RepID=UPI003D9794C7
MPTAGTRSRWTLVVVLTAVFVDLLDASIASVALPAIRSDLGASEADLQWFVAAYVLGLGAGLITGGRLGDRYGRRRLLLFGMGAFVVFSIACALATSPAALIAARALQGIAAAAMVPQVLAIIRSDFEGPALARAFGAYGATVGLASVAGPLFGGILVDADLAGLGWRAIFWINVPIGLAAIAAGLAVIPESRERHARGLDLPGALLGAATVLLLLFPLVRGRELGWPGWLLIPVAAAVVTGAVFARWQRRTAAAGGDPLVEPSLLRDRGFIAGLGTAFLFFGGIGAFFLVLVIYLQLGTGRSALDSGLLLVPYALGSAITSVLAVRVRPIAGRGQLATGALLLAASNLLLLTVVAVVPVPAWWALAGPLALGGVGLGLTAPPLTGVVLAGIEPRTAGVAAGALNTVIQVGSAAGIAVFGTIFFATAESGGTTGAWREALLATLPWTALAYALAAALIGLLPRPSPATPKTDADHHAELS